MFDCLAEGFAESHPMASHSIVTTVRTPSGVIAVRTVIIRII
jgi:hypothetical protein